MTVGVSLAFSGAAAAQELLRPPADISISLFPAGRTEFEVAPSQDILNQWPSGTARGKTLAPALLISAGLFAFREDGFFNRRSVQEWRHTYFPTFQTELDNYTRDVPALLTFGLNIAGVKGRSKFLRALVNYATAYTINNVAFSIGKSLTEVERPDGDGNRSFPSGHTSTAFMGATFLHKEYGAKSSLYSIAGYSIATVTGGLRILNDKHWLSDVLVSAGLGILSTEIAYILVDHVAGDWMMNPPPEPRPLAGPESRRPSFLNFKAGYARLLGDANVHSDLLTVENGWTAGFEGAYFFSQYVGIGGKAAVGAFPIDADRFDPPTDLAVLAEDILAEPLASRSLFIGPFFDLPISDKWSANGAVTAGWATGAEGEVLLDLREVFEEDFDARGLPVVRFRGGDSVGFAASLGLRGMLSHTIGLSLFAEYNYSRPDYEVEEATGIDRDGNVIWGSTEVIENVRFDYFGIGAALYAMVW